MRKLTIELKVKEEFLTDVPEKFVKGISDGRKEYYWNPPNTMFKKK